MHEILLGKLNPVSYASVYQLMEEVTLSVVYLSVLVRYQGLPW